MGITTSFAIQRVEPLAAALSAERLLTAGGPVRSVDLGTTLARAAHSILVLTLLALESLAELTLDFIRRRIGLIGSSGVRIVLLISRFHSYSLTGSRARDQSPARESRIPQTGQAAGRVRRGVRQTGNP